MTRNLPPAPARRPKRGAHASLHPDLSPARTVFRPALLALAVAVATAGAPLPAAAAGDSALDARRLISRIRQGYVVYGAGGRHQAGARLLQILWSVYTVCGDAAGARTRGAP